MGRSAEVILAAALCFVGQGARAEDFYRGKTVNIIVGFSPGGGFDINARLLSRHMGRHIPGRPDMVVTNMPGAASLTGVQYLENIAPKDGTALATFNFGLIGDSRVFPERVKADFRKFGWMGSVSQDVTACYTWGALGLKSLDQVRKRPEVHMGDVGVGTSAFVNQNILKNIFGVNVKQVLGYPGSAEQRIAIERGELDGDCGAWPSLPADWIDGNKVNALMRSAPVLADGMPPGVPYMADIAPDEKSRKIIELLTASGQLGRPFIASPAVPVDRLGMLRRAFDETMRDPEFLADARKIRHPVTPKIAAEALKIVDDIYASPDDIVKAARAIAGGD
jgi:tripartite-type tricarboxylate transporter receptor subunit TctC